MTAVYYARTTTDTVAVLTICLAPLALILLLAWLDSTIGPCRPPVRRPHTATRGRHRRIVGPRRQPGPLPRPTRLVAPPAFSRATPGHDNRRAPSAAGETQRRDTR